jgi:microcystin-dependent protein
MSASRVARPRLLWALLPLAFSSACVTTRQLNQALREQVPVGSIAPYSGFMYRLRPDRSDSRWMIADGRSLNRNDYPELFAAIGASWGSSSPSTFNIPDLRGRFLRGVDSLANRDPGPRNQSAPGGASGKHVGTIQDDALQQHQHDIVRNSIDGTNNTRDADSGGQKWNADPGAGHLSVGDVKGGRVSSETRPVNAYVYWIIRVR